MDKLENFRKISGNTLKIIACVTMFIDHIGAVIILPLTRDGLLPAGISFYTLNLIYRILRNIGRTSFPLFLFLITEGFTHTSSRLRYALSLLVFALVSELPYDYSFYGKISSSNNNIGITLFLSLITLWSISSANDFFRKKNIPQLHLAICSVLIVLFTSVTASFLRCDYKYYGILLAVIFYFFKPIFPLNIIIAYIVISTYSTEWLSFPAFILIYLYNQKQGKKLGRYKYLFYAFYPVHLILLYMIRLIISNYL